MIQISSSSEAFGRLSSACCIRSVLNLACVYFGLSCVVAHSNWQICFVLYKWITLRQASCKKDHNCLSFSFFSRAKYKDKLTSCSWSKCGIVSHSLSLTVSKGKSEAIKIARRLASRGIGIGLKKVSAIKDLLLLSCSVWSWGFWTLKSSAALTRVYGAPFGN